LFISHLNNKENKFSTLSSVKSIWGEWGQKKPGKSRKEQKLRAGHKRGKKIYIETTFLKPYYLKNPNHIW